MRSRSASSKSRMSPWPTSLPANGSFLSSSKRLHRANIVRQIEPLLPDGPLRQSMMKELARIRGLLTPGDSGLGDEVETAISRVAGITIRQIGSALTVSESVQS